MTYADKRISCLSVQQMITLYQDTARHPNLAKFDISGLTSINEAIEAGRDRSGVYILYRKNRTLIYFGLSMRSVSARLAKHMSKNERLSVFWESRPPALAQTVFVTHSWEAPSLEEFLIQQAQAYTGLNL